MWFDLLHEQKDIYQYLSFFELLIYLNENTKKIHVIWQRKGLVFCIYQKDVKIIIYVDRAEEYFKRASKVEPKDAEALSKYSNFLWEIRKDLWGAEQNLLEAIAIDPFNSFYTATYANFLWNTTSGDDDSCFPLDSPQLWSKLTTVNPKLQLKPFTHVRLVVWKSQSM